MVISGERKNEMTIPQNPNSYKINVRVKLIILRAQTIGSHGGSLRDNERTILSLFITAYYSIYDKKEKTPQ